MFNRKSLPMALHLAIQNQDQLAISQPPDQERIGRKGRLAARRLRKSWSLFTGLWSRRIALNRTPEESAIRINAAQDKRERRMARNLRHMNKAA